MSRKHYLTDFIISFLRTNRGGKSMQQIIEALDKDGFVFCEGVVKVTLSQMKGRGYLSTIKRRCECCARPAMFYYLTEKGHMR